MGLPKGGQQTHKAGPLKQKNKIHKTGRHRSKGILDLEQKGRVPKLSVSSTASSKKSLSRMARKNKIVQIKRLRNEVVQNQKRSLGSSISPPFLTAIINLTGTYVDWEGFFKRCQSAAVVEVSSTGIVHVNVQRLKQRFSFICPERDNLLSCLDSLKVADSVMIAWPADGELNPDQNTLLTACFSHGLPTCIHVVQGNEELAKKRRDECRKLLSRTLEQWSFETKFHSLENEADLLVVLRQVGSVKRKRLSLQESRAHLVAESISVEPDSSSEDRVSLKVFGYVRGPPLGVNGLIHVPGVGDFQMNSIDCCPDAFPLTVRKEMEEVRVLEVADSSQQEPLQAEVIPDLMAMDQVLSDADGHSVTLISDGKVKKVRRVPKGTSDYQACWIVENKDEEEEVVDPESQKLNESDDEMDADMEADEDEDDSGTEGTSGDSDEDKNEEFADDEDDGQSEVEPKDSRYDEKVAADDEELVAKFRKERENEMFPDEIDTPLDTPARIRFQRYRGLKSFRTSPIDPKENLPFDYSRIFQFENFRLSRKRALSEQNGGALAGFYVCVHIANFPSSKIDVIRNRLPLVVYGLLKHEQKFTTVNMVIKKVADYTAPIASKEKLIFHVGYRRFQAQPIFSQHTNGDKHKYERFMPSTAPVVATVFAPIVYPPATVLVFKQNSEDGTAQLVATGSVLDVNPNRITMKRIVLSGHPFKINRKSAVVRYMFFNREDVLWFKPIELVTKYGRKGHIKEPLGTHGHMKCVFDGQLNSQDSVLMKLYKRVFPKWSYEVDSATYSLCAKESKQLEDGEAEMETV